MQPTTEMAERWSPTELSVTDQTAIAIWLAKMAVVHEPLAGREQRLSTVEQRASLQRRELPRHWLVRIGAYVGEGSHFEMSLGAVVTYDEDSPFRACRLSTRTLRFEAFLGQVVVHDLPVLPTISSLLGGDTFSIAIPAESVVSWPPRRAIEGAEWLDIVRDTPR